MFTNLYLRTSCGLIELSAFDRIGRITQEAYAQLNTGAMPFTDCQFVVIGYYPHYARLMLPVGGTLPVQSRGTPSHRLGIVPQAAAARSLLNVATYAWIALQEPTT